MALALTHTLADKVPHATVKQKESPAASWQQQLLPTQNPGRQIRALWSASEAPAYRLIVVPGSGCAGMGPIASQYFSGLNNAEIWILHKPYVQPWRAMPPDGCDPGFVQYDRLTTWQADALSAVEAILHKQSHLPVLLLGISEGAEILPGLARHVGPSLRGLVLLSASGLDPAEAFQMQLQKSGHASAWTRLKTLAASDSSDAKLVNGRSLGYWRDMFNWSVQQPLMELALDVLQVWGDDDELVPAQAYQTFIQRSLSGPIRLCSWSWAGTTHALRTATGQQLQPLVWSVLNLWASHGHLECPFKSTD